MNPSVMVGRLSAVTVLKMDRPDVRNAVDAETARALHAAFVAFDGDAEARVAVFHGDGSDSETLRVRSRIA